MRKQLIIVCASSMVAACSGGMAVVALMPVPVPKGEADDAARFSVSATGTGWKLPDHKAHLIVSLQNINSSAPVANLVSRPSWRQSHRQTTPGGGYCGPNCGRAPAG